MRSMHNSQHQAAKRAQHAQHPAADSAACTALYWQAQHALLISDITCGCLLLLQLILLSASIGNVTTATTIAAPAMFVSIASEARALQAKEVHCYQNLMATPTCCAAQQSQLQWQHIEHQQAQ